MIENIGIIRVSTAVICISRIVEHSLNPKVEGQDKDGEVVSAH